MIKDNTKILIVSVLLAVVVGFISSLAAIGLFPEISQVYAVKTLNEDDVAKSFQVKIITKYDGIKLVYDSFSRVGFVSSNEIEFLLESIPSVDKKPFYKLVKKSLNPVNYHTMNIEIGVFSGDGVLIETLKYANCDVTSYFIYMNDSTGKYNFLKNDKSDMEIREITKFKCTGFDIIV